MSKIAKVLVPAGKAVLTAVGLGALAGTAIYTADATNRALNSTECAARWLLRSKRSY